MNYYLQCLDMMDSKLKTELKPIKEDIHSLKGEVGSVKEEINSVKGEVNSLNEGLNSLKAEVHQVKLYQENIITPRLDTIESCYMDTFKRYQNYADKMDMVIEDVSLLKKVVTEHSVKLQKLA